MTIEKRVEGIAPVVEELWLWGRSGDRGRPASDVELADGQTSDTSKPNAAERAKLALRGMTRPLSDCRSSQA